MIERFLRERKEAVQRLMFHQGQARRQAQTVMALDERLKKRPALLGVIYLIREGGCCPRCEGPLERLGRLTQQDPDGPIYQVWCRTHDTMLIQYQED